MRQSLVYASIVEREHALALSLCERYSVTASSTHTSHHCSISILPPPLPKLYTSSLPSPHSTPPLPHYTPPPHSTSSSPLHLLPTPPPPHSTSSSPLHLLLPTPPPPPHSTSSSPLHTSSPATHLLPHYTPPLPLLHFLISHYTPPHSRHSKYTTHPDEFVRSNDIPS